MSPLILDTSHFDRDPRGANVAPMAFGDFQAFAGAAVVTDKNGGFRFLARSHAV
jgi:hypothetical protein